MHGKDKQPPGHGKFCKQSWRKSAYTVVRLVHEDIDLVQNSQHTSAPTEMIDQVAHNLLHLICGTAALTDEVPKCIPQTPKSLRFMAEQSLLADQPDADKFVLL